MRDLCIHETRMEKHFWLSYTVFRQEEWVVSVSILVPPCCYGDSPSVSCSILSKFCMCSISIPRLDIIMEDFLLSVKQFAHFCHACIPLTRLTIASFLTATLLANPSVAKYRSSHSLCESSKVLFPQCLVLLEHTDGLTQPLFWQWVPLCGCHGSGSMLAADWWMVAGLVRGDTLSAAWTISCHYWQYSSHSRSTRRHLIPSYYYIGIYYISHRQHEDAEVPFLAATWSICMYVL